MKPHRWGLFLKPQLPLLAGAPIDIEKTFKFREHLQPENKENIIGVQGQLWSEKP
ncbi:MAG: hypothetical protein CM1200mP10_23000 [Candidatus Neomarinimicrobiota bacterium]|nr:MAG: hypothetical protein CM1200mP10_23000 [Candidatus Neomarinimicrobiota bacterium]